MGLATAAQAAWVEVDNFDGYDNSSITSIGASGGGDATAGTWDGVFDGTGNARILDVSGSNQALDVLGIPGQGAGGWRGAQTDLANNFATDLTIADNTTATIFFQFRALSGGGNFDTMFGLTDTTANLDNSNSWQDFAVMPYLAGGGVGAADFQVTEGVVIMDVVADAWYNVWLVVDTTANTFDVYSSTGTDNGALGVSGSAFRNGLGMGSLASFGLSQAQDGHVQIDNIYIDQAGANTTFAVPEPNSFTLIGLFGVILAAVRRRTRG
jgi:hypothetical protein